MVNLCIGIFFARIFDVTLGTIRTLYMTKGKTWITAILAFFEVLIWFVVARKALTINNNSILIPIFYALGYATGTWLGSMMANIFIKGRVSIEIITYKNNKELHDMLRKDGCEISIIPIVRPYDEKKKEMIITEVNKKSLKKKVKLIMSYDQDSFIMINDTRVVNPRIIKGF